MKQRTTMGLAALGMAAAALATGSANAGLIEVGTYLLHSHPDGNQSPPPYGLRLDELFDVTSGHDVFTFDFDADGAEMLLDYDGTSMRIHGTAFGGLDTGNGYDPDVQSMVAIDFTYGLVVPAPGDDDLVAINPDGTNSGSITWLETGEEIALSDYSGDNPYTFRFGDEDDDLGHRGFDGLSGWGWLTHGPGEHIGASDWLFTAEYLPAPGALAFLGLGVFARRRRRD